MLARVVALGALVAAVALLALAMFGGGDGYKVKAVFQNAGALVPGNPVQVGGAKIGSVDEIELDNSANAVVTLKLDDDFVPLHEGSEATIRATSLSGIANRYVSLQPGPNNAKEIEDGGQIDADHTSAPVDIDTLFNTLNPRTRRGLRNVIRGLGDQYDGKGEQAREATKYFSPFLVSTSDVTKELALDQAVLERFVKDGATTVTALAERRDDLAGLVSNTNATFGAIAQENASLDRALELLPDTLRKANTTFVNLRATLDDLDKLVAVSKPGTKQLAPFLRELRPLVHDARPTIQDLNTIVSASGKNNDLIDLTAKQPQPRGPHRIGVPARDQDPQPGAAGIRVRTGLHARPRGLDLQLRAAGGQLRRQRPLRPRPADVPPHHVQRRDAHREPALPEVPELLDRQHHPLPGWHRPGGARRLEPRTRRKLL